MNLTCHVFVISFFDYPQLKPKYCKTGLILILDLKGLDLGSDSSCGDFLGMNLVLIMYNYIVVEHTLYRESILCLSDVAS